MLFDDTYFDAPFALGIWHICKSTQFHPFSTIFTLFPHFLLIFAACSPFYGGATTRRMEGVIAVMFLFEDMVHGNTHLHMYGLHMRRKTVMTRMLLVTMGMCARFVAPSLMLRSCPCVIS